ncbi:hypothetical protein Hypma_001780 [Hypsizygus marmoreus]|uniref:F-box domain-containing protein n=1 Tax=Hypsizygus marmoreus TaxID=39966 RepID=A0A369J9N8_HYPMA|nr:hypothetical protein Hypma_001780 [Hypsizygus marmoreus]
MHRSLQITELRLSICSFLQEDKFAGPSALARLARTYSKFQGPALDALWYSQPSLFNLLKCLPTDAFYVETKYDDSRVLCLRRDLHPADYERVRYYSGRIKALGVSWGDPDIHSLAMSVLWTQQKTCGALLPNLRHLEINVSNFVGQAMYPRLVCVPTLRSVTVHVELQEVNDQHMATSVDCMGAVLHPHMQHLEAFAFSAHNSQWDFNGHCGSPPAIMKIHSAFCDIQYIDTRAFEINRTSLSHISHLPNVKTLKIAITAAELSSFNLTSARQNDFPALIEFRIETGELPGCSDLLTRPGFDRLQSLTITQCSRAGVWNLGPLFHTMQQYLSHSRLKELNIVKCSPYWRPPHEACNVTLAALTPLLSFSNLAVLQITIDITVTLDKIALEDIAVAWPNLRVFRLFESTTRTIPSTKLVDLLNFAASCVSLEEVTLRVDALHPPTFLEHGPTTPSPSVRRLNVCTSPICAEHSAISTILNLAFPSLELLLYGWDYIGPGGNAEFVEMTRVERRYAECWRSCYDDLWAIIAHRGTGGIQYLDYT